MTSVRSKKRHVGAKNDTREQKTTPREQKTTHHGAKNDTNEQKMTLGAKNDMTGAKNDTPSKN